MLKPVFRAGETYTIARDIGETDAISYWIGQSHETFVAEENAHILGTYFLRANQAGGADLCPLRFQASGARLRWCVCDV